jgi:hypothetical protein
VAVFRRGQAARVLRQVFARDALVASGGGAGATLGSWRLDREGCAGRIEDQAGDLVVDCQYRLHGPEVTMVPGWVGRLSPSVPALRSTPGTVIAATGGAGQAVPCVFTRYRVGDLARARWFLISAQAFEGVEPGTDVRCEISGGWFGGRWALTGYLRLGAELVPLNHPLANLRRFRAPAVGGEVGATRRFEVTYRGPRLSLRLTAEAPADAFVVLEREGATTIHTTLFGSCALELTVAGARRQLVARDRCLLEVKG